MLTMSNCMIKITFKVISIENTAVKKASKYLRIYKTRSTTNINLSDFETVLR